MRFSSTNLQDLLIVEPDLFRDERGFFLETYQEQRYTAAGISGPFVQDNHSGSRFGTLRGLHYQIRQAQGKLIRVVAGEAFDVAVDLRRSSPTFGRWEGIRLSGENKLQLWIPPGFAHGFYVLSDWAELIYKATDYYAPQWERTLLWNDPAINISWPLTDTTPLLISPKDVLGKPLREAETFP